ncbi:hypothetical protein RBXJA2T_12097 [Rubrivivax benzoatilyticus JA2 = ATCC BAA-35]|nr:hypothetical protein RBXJA2T_12097 [Rubrivivax benzoatilyticus JA2 = ATCC BAA-35]
MKQVRSVGLALEIESLAAPAVSVVETRSTSARRAARVSLAAPAVSVG